MAGQRKYLEIGSKHGRWTVLELVPILPYVPTEYECQCDCGKKSILGTNTLRRKTSVQCGTCANTRWRKLCFKCKGPLNE